LELLQGMQWMVSSQVGCKQGNMTIDGHKHGRGEVHLQKRKAEMDKELNEI
jgi:hypothetical protein